MVGIINIFDLYKVFHIYCFVIPIIRDHIPLILCLSRNTFVSFRRLKLSIVSYVKHGNSIYNRVI